MILRYAWQWVVQIHFLIHVYYFKVRRAAQSRASPQSRTKFYAAVLPEREAIGKSMDKPATGEGSA